MNFDITNLKIGVVGHQGRMGCAILEVLKDKNLIAITAGGEIDGDKLNLFQQSDVVIDFSSEDGLKTCLNLANQMHKPLVSGSTPVNNDLMKNILDVSKNTKICWSANMSIGIAITKKIISTYGKILHEYDCEILEKHHNKKKDAPSGTAISLGQAVANSRGVNLDDVKVIDRNTIRQKEQIGFASIRGGSIFGEHSIMFIGNDDEITITHKAYNRKLFAIGAVECAIKLVQQKQNGFYTLEDLLL